MRPIVTEDQIQRTIVEGLTVLGYTVLITSRRRKRCTNCGQFPGGGDGASKGVPDLLVTRDEWDTPSQGWALWCGLEVKGPKTKVSPEQRELSNRGLINIVRSFDEAIHVVRCTAGRHGLVFK